MERLIKIGNVKKKFSIDVKNSKIGIGFEKLDRNVFDPEKAYDRVAELGVKWVRIQSGWQRTEIEKGVYDFEWIDKIVDNLITRGLQPWICLCYGNKLYSEDAAKVFGAVGVPPIFNDEQKNAWKNYVKEVVARYKGKVDLFEVWNEPDGKWCWKHGVNATELGNFTIATAKAVKEANPDAKVVGGVCCHADLNFINEAMHTGMGNYLDYVSYHQYTHDETAVVSYVKALRSLCKSFNNKIEIIQGESGSQSRSGGCGAVKEGAWTPERQAKQLLRHSLADFMAEVEFTSYFSCMDMIEALNGVVGDIGSYTDFGYFGVLGADFDEEGHSIGTYTPKMSYWALQTISSIFAEEFSLCDIPVMLLPQESKRFFGFDCSEQEVVHQGFSKPDGSKAFVYWYPSNILKIDYEATVTLQIAGLGKNFKLVDLMDGSVYKIPENMIEDQGYGCYKLINIPIKDYPLMLTFDNFEELE